MMSLQKDKTFVFIVGWFLFVCFLSLGIKTEPRLRDFCCSIWKNITKKHFSDGDIKAEFQFKYTLFHLSIKSTQQNEETNHLKLLKLILNSHCLCRSLLLLRKYFSQIRHKTSFRCLITLPFH